MRMPWNKSTGEQLELIDATATSSTDSNSNEEPRTDAPRRTKARDTPALDVVPAKALLVSIECLYEDPDNPRTEFPEDRLEELAEDIRAHGILQPIVVHPADGLGGHRIHFGAMRLRAAKRAGLHHVPVAVRTAAADPYAQVAENQKRCPLSPLELARFIRSRSDAGDSNATIAKRLGMDLTTVTHHLTLLELPPEVEAAMQSGRCTSPRTLHELSKLHRDAPKQLRTLLDGDGDITRAALKAARTEPEATKRRTKAARLPHVLRTKAELACTRLERALDQLANAEPSTDEAGLDALKTRLASLAGRLG